MTITIKLFSRMKELAGASEFVLESEGRISCAKAVSQFAMHCFNSLDPIKQCAVAKNGSFVTGEAFLTDGDELAILPPVSGG